MKRRAIGGSVVSGKTEQRRARQGKEDQARVAQLKAGRLEGQGRARQGRTKRVRPMHGSARQYKAQGGIVP